MPEESQSPSSRDATDARFSTRSLLIIMAVVAVAATALGVFIRSFPVNVQPQIAMSWGTLVLIILVVVVFHAWRRQRAERTAGRVLFRLVHRMPYFPNAPDLALILPAVAGIVAATAVWVWVSFSIARLNSQPWWQAMVNEACLCSILSSGTGITYSWWRCVRLCENGVVYKARFLPWHECRRWYWDAGNRNVLVLEYASRMHIELWVPSNDNAGIQSLLDSRLAGKRYD